MILLKISFLQIQRKDIDKLIIESKTPDILIVKNLSEFFNQIDLEVKISNNDIFLIQAFDKERNYSESAVYTRNEWMSDYIRMIKINY